MHNRVKLNEMKGPGQMMDAKLIQRQIYERPSYLNSYRIFKSENLGSFVQTLEKQVTNAHQTA
jgi:hypothetical protein